MTEETPEPGVAHILSSLSARRKRTSGQEPADLERIARWLDGDLPPQEQAAVAARVAAEPELAAMVAALREHDQATTLPSNVIPFKRPAPDQRRPSPMRKALIGTGSALAIAAIAFVATRPTPTPTALQGAAVGTSGDTNVTAAFDDTTRCEISGTLTASEPQLLWYVGEHGATALGEHAPGAFRVKPACAPAACEAIVATPRGAAAPTLDPTTCGPTEALPASRLTR